MTACRVTSSDICGTPDVFDFMALTAQGDETAQALYVAIIVVVPFLVSLQRVG
jgi:hypothetical protein